MNVEISDADYDVPWLLFRCCTGRYRELQLLLLSRGSDVSHRGCLPFAVTSALHKEERIGRTNHHRDSNARDPEQTCGCVGSILTEFFFLQSYWKVYRHVIKRSWNDPSSRDTQIH